MSWENPRRRRRRATPKRRRSSPRRLFRIRRKPIRIPVEMLAGAAAVPFVPPAPGWSSPVSALQQGRFDLALQSLVRGFTGLAIGGVGGQPHTYFNAWNTINPFDFNEAPYWKILFWTGLIGSLRAKLFKSSSALMRKIPLIGRWIK